MAPPASTGCAAAERRAPTRALPPAARGLLATAAGARGNAALAGRVVPVVEGYTARRFHTRPREVLMLPTIGYLIGVFVPELF